MAKQRKTSKKQLTAADLEKFKEMLLAKRQEILGNVVSMEDASLRKERSELSNIPLHMADAGSDTYEMENTLGLMDSERKLITEIDDALRRMEEGSYGVCQGNNEMIPKERLNAIPWARYCVECASMVEKGLVKREDFINRYDFAGSLDEEESEYEEGDRED